MPDPVVESKPWYVTQFRSRKQMSAYMAGFFDGEGCVGIHKCTGAAKAFPYNVSVQINQMDRKPLELFQSRYGGSIYFYKQKKATFGTCDIHHWIAADKAAERCLRDLLPYLIVKKRKAAQASVIALLSLSS